MIVKPSAGSLIDRTHPQLFGCAHWWPMLAGGGLTARDLIGGIHATFSSFAAGSEWAAGKDGLAPLFDGINDRLSLATSIVMTVANGATATFRAKRNSLNTSDTVLGITTSASVSMLRFTNAGTLVFESDTNGDEATGTLLADDTAWHNYACVLNNTVAQFYQDGRALVMSDGTLGGNPFTFNRIGTSQTSTNPFHGQMDDVRIYRRALSRAEIADIRLDPWAPVIGWNEPDSEGFWLADAAAGGRRHQQHSMHMGLSLAI